MWPFISLRQRVIMLPSPPSAVVKTGFAPSTLLFSSLLSLGGGGGDAPPHGKICFCYSSFPLYMGSLPFCVIIYEASVLSSPSFKSTTFTFLTIFCVVYLEGLSDPFSYFIIVFSPYLTFLLYFYFPPHTINTFLWITHL